MARITNWWDTLDAESARWYLAMLLGSVVILSLGKFFVDLSNTSVAVKKARQQWNELQ